MGNHDSYSDHPILEHITVEVMVYLRKQVVTYTSLT